jgi:hypothetical protein
MNKSRDWSKSWGGRMKCRKFWKTSEPPINECLRNCSCCFHFAFFVCFRMLWHSCFEFSQFSNNFCFVFFRCWLWGKRWNFGWNMLLVLNKWNEMKIKIENSARLKAFSI